VPSLSAEPLEFVSHWQPHGTTIKTEDQTKRCCLGEVDISLAILDIDIWGPPDNMRTEVRRNALRVTNAPSYSSSSLYVSSLKRGKKLAQSTSLTASLFLMTKVCQDKGIAVKSPNLIATAHLSHAGVLVDSKWFALKEIDMLGNHVRDAVGTGTR
jgi:hypothetical protein